MTPDVTVRARDRAGAPKTVWLFERRDGARLVRMSGHLGLAEIRFLDAQIERIAQPGERVVLDLGAVTHVDYRGLAILNRRAERLACEGGALALCGVSDYVRAILSLESSPAGLLEVHERVEDALALEIAGVS